MTQNGFICKLKDHKVSFRNLLVLVDYANPMGVEHIEKMEAALEQEGHLSVHLRMGLEEDIWVELAQSSVFEDSDEYEALGK